MFRIAGQLPALTPNMFARKLLVNLKWSRDRPKPISLVSAVAETVAETRDTYMALTES